MAQLSRPEILTELEDLHRELYEAGQNEADFVLEVIDMLEGWSHPQDQIAI